MSLDKSGDNKALLDEWDTARTILKDTDDRLDNLRKYGFTFVTGLLTAESFLLPYIPSSPTVTFNPEIKLAVVGATLVLIVALQIMDRNYQVLAEAAAKRALVIENNLNIELTGVISLRFNQSKVKIFYSFVYLFLTIGVLVLGLVAVPNFRILIIVFSALAVFAIGFFHKFELDLPRGPGDWTINGLNFNPGDQIGITLFSLCPASVGRKLRKRRKKSIFFMRNQIMWAIANEENGKILHCEIASDDGFQLLDGDSHLWLWTFPPDTQAGVYEIWRAVPTKPVTMGEAWKKLLFRKSFSLKGYFLDEQQNSSEVAGPPEKLSSDDLQDINAGKKTIYMLLSQVKDPIKYDELSFSQLLDVIAGEKIWKEFQYAPLPQDIIIKKESDKSEPAPKTNSSEKTKDAIRINGTHISDFKDHERVLDESDGTSPNIGSRSQPE